MKLTDLFPNLPKIILNNTEYELKYATRAMLQLEIDYPSQVVGDQEITSQERILTVLNSAFTQMKTIDLVNLLYAGLIHTGSFKKETLVDAMQPYDFNTYMGHIVSAWRLCKATPEQLEKMEVMAAASKSKKKADQEITAVSMPTIESNAG